jgi:alkylation response protein AidB-like acyl-CoA dehydrogenase/class 3 adenylate cyclase
VIGVVLSAYFVGRSLLAPLGVLSRAMTKVADGDLHQRVPVTSNDEVGALTAQFNTMVEGLREREKIRETFGRYVDESVAATILRRQGEASGEIGEATILFTDIAGFTTIAEYLAPAELVAALNEYLETVLEPIRRHGGIVNTFIGDGLFASFNMPLACPDHACAAVQAAIDIQRAVGSRTFGDHGVALATRVGISTGPVIGGSVGAGQRLSYTLLGDTVNLAARLETLNKDHGTRILVSQSTRDACAERFAFTPLGAVAVRGPQRTDCRLHARFQPSGSFLMNASGLSPEQLKLQARARELAAGPVAKRAAEVDRTEQYPWDNVELLKDARLIGMTIPQQYGGQGKGWLDAVLAIEALSSACAVTGGSPSRPTWARSARSWPTARKSRRSWRPTWCCRRQAAICITEPEAGSDAGGMTTRADKKGNRYVINGRKHWITGGGVSRLHLIFAKVFDEQGNEEGIGGFLPSATRPRGLKITKREPTMGLRGIPEAVIDFEDMDVPPSALVIPPRGLKKGFADLMNAYNSQRVGAATVALGIAEGAYQLGARLVGATRSSSAGRSTSSRACNGSSPTCRSSSRRRRRWSTTRALRRRRLSRHAAGGASQGLHLGERHPGGERSAAVLRRARLSRASCRSNAWRATCACSPSAAARRRCCATSWRRAPQEEAAARPAMGRDLRCSDVPTTAQEPRARRSKRRRQPAPVCVDKPADMVLLVQGAGGPGDALHFGSYARTSSRRRGRAARAVGARAGDGDPGRVVPARRAALAFVKAGRQRDLRRRDDASAARRVDRQHAARRQPRAGHRQEA